jgi:hypothetical protein
LPSPFCIVILREAKDLLFVLAVARPPTQHPIISTEGGVFAA